MTRSRAVRWYGDKHPDAAAWDDLDAHRELLLELVEEFDGWAIATTPDGLGAYHPLPIACHVMAWVRPAALPGGTRILHRWEPVIVYPPVGRRARGEGIGHVSDVLTARAPADGFPGAKPAAWTHWVLSALGHDPDVDEVVDLFPGSGAVAAAAQQGRLL